jgi:hypothetical protein
MNLFWKIIFWTLTIGLGFVNPVITFVLVILYYLPGILQDNCENNNKSDSQRERKSESTKNQGQMKEFSKDTIEEYR